MSGFRNYSQWSKGSTNSSYSGSSSSKTEPTTSSKYDPIYPRSNVDGKRTSDTSSGLRLGQKYGSYSSPSATTTAASREPSKYSSASPSVATRIKETLEKKETSHPPISYRPISRTGARSRDPSAERDTPTLPSHNYNRLYPPSSYAPGRSVSRDRTESTTSTSSATTIPKYSGRSSITKELGRPSKAESREDLSLAKYKATSREDLDILPKKYINSRFLPKNTIEKSNTAYTRPSSTRIASSQRETSRKNRELLNLINTQSEISKSSRPVSRCSSNMSEDCLKTKSTESKSKESKSTSNSKSTNASATPWSSYLDLKFSSPKTEDKTSKSASQKSSSSPKNLSRNNSTKSPKSSPKAVHKTETTKKLPPQIPGLQIPNKDFRKSVLNMSPEKKGLKSQRSASVSSAESEAEVLQSEATDVSENLSSCRSFHKTSSTSSKLPKRATSEATDPRSRRSNTRSPSEGSSNSTAVTSGSEDDSKSKSSKSKSESKIKRNLSSSRTSLVASSLVDDGSEKAPKPPISPRPKHDCSKTETEAKSFLIRALAPVTGLFKSKSESSENADKNAKSSNQEEGPKFKIRSIESGERAWWQEKNQEESEGKSKSSTSKKSPKKLLCRVDSGTLPWWLDENAPIPDGVEVYQENGEVTGIMSPEYQQKYKIRHIDSGERAWWLSSNENISEANSKQSDSKKVYKITHQGSGEKAWWLISPEISKKSGQESDSETDGENGVPLGDRASPEGLEMPKENEGRLTPYDNVPNSGSKPKRPDSLFISRHKNIDDILGGVSQCWSPLMNRIFVYQEQGARLGDDCQEVKPEQVKIHDSTPQHGIIQPNRLGTTSSASTKLDDASLQLYKDGDYGSYLDLEASISEQQEEFEGFQSNKKNSIVLRTQLSVRVHTIIEKLLTSEGRELRRALFSLKQIFQEDKDLVHEFVQNDGLACLIKVGSEADQNYQNYILRALGQVMLYVDGMNGVIQHNETIQWLYSLISSKFRLVVKTALKLLLVFVEYIDSNCLLLIKAVHNVDCTQGLLPWYNIMKLLKDFDSADTELLIYAMTLINKCFNGIPDQDTYYDQADSLEEQGIELIIQRYMSKPGTDLDLLQQFQIYEAVLQYEDAEEKGIPLRHLDESVRKTLRSRKSGVVSAERRKSRRHSTGTTPLHSSLNLKKSNELQANNEGNYTNALQQRITNGNLLNRTSSRKDLTPLLNAVNKLDSEEGLTKQPWILSMMYEQNQENMGDANENDRNLLLQLKRENTVKDLTQKLANQNVLHSPSEENKINRIGDMTGLISKAKEGLAKSKSKVDVLKSPTSENVPKIEAKKSENELRWEELMNSLNRPLNLCDMDFTDLGSEDETDILAPAAATNGIPPPPPPLMGNMCAPPPPPLNNRAPPPVPNPPNLQKIKTTESKIPIKKNKKTVKLFWKEVRDDPITAMKLKTGLIWDELANVSVDTQKLEHLFESRAKDLITKKQQELNKNKEIIVLDPKRSNAINIGMTKLPPPRSIKTAILKMDATIMNREGIEKLLTMLPTEEERTKIQDAQAASPDLPLGSAEQFLLTLASISELPARLNLWAFKLDFENSEREIAEPLMDLKQGYEVLRVNKTFRGILSTLLSIGIFLNGTEVKGFQIEYLAKVPEVKDTVHKHSLLHHLCHIVMEKFPDATDLYSEIGAITRASKIDFDELALNIQRLESDCKASWDHLKLIAKHDGSTMMKVKMSDFLTDCAERIILLGIVHRRVMNRFHRFLLWLGIPLHQIADTKPNEFCRIVSEFSLEYRTTRERVLQQLEKKANHRERNKTRGKMITEIGKFRTKEDRADAELRQLLGSDMSDVESLQGTLTWRRRSRDTNRSSLNQVNGNLTDGDDEILESLVKTATKGPSRTAPRERKRTRHADRKSLKRSRTRENNPFGSRDSP